MTSTNKRRILDIQTARQTDDDTPMAPTSPSEEADEYHLIPPTSEVKARARANVVAVQIIKEPGTPKEAADFVAMEQCIIGADDDQGNSSASTNFVSSIWSLLRSRISQRPSPTTTVQGCYMALAAILGTFSRMTSAQLFGEECWNPGSVGWLASEAALCLTTEGESDQVGGIIFAELPANVLGCFLMGRVPD